MKSLLKRLWLFAAAAAACVTAAYAAPDNTPAATSIIGRVTDLETRTKNDGDHMLDIQAEARKQQDIIKLNCVNDKLVQLKAQQNVFDNVRASLNGAQDLTAGFAELTEHADAIARLRQETDVCAGKADLYSQESNEVRHSLFPDDPAKDPFQTDVEAPGYASPFR